MCLPLQSVYDWNLGSCFKNNIDACLTVFSIIQISQGLWDISLQKDWPNRAHMTFQNSAGEKSEIDSTGFELQLLRGLPFLCGLLRWGHLFLLLVAASIFWYIDVFLRNRTCIIYLYIIHICVCVSISPSICLSIHLPGIGSRSHSVLQSTSWNKHSKFQGEGRKTPAPQFRSQRGKMTST